MACGLASADSMLGPLSCGTTGTQPTELGPSDGQLNCPGANINTLLYHLTEAVLTVNGAIKNNVSFQSILDITNNSATTQSGNAYAYSTFYVDQTSGPPNSVAMLQNFSGLNTGFTPGSAGPPPTLPTGMFSVFGETPGYPTPISLGPGVEDKINVSGASSATGTDTNSTDLNNWSGVTGFSFINDTASGEQNTFTGGNVTVTQTTFVNAGAVVTYYYASNVTTPEPTTMALLGGALLGIGLIGKRLRKS